MKPIGIINLKCLIKDIEKNQRFVIVKAKVMLLLGLQTCREFNLIKRIHMIEGHSSKKIFIAENIDVFEDSGTLKKKRVKLK